MPRLENKKHELYCYARVYHQMPKLKAIEFAGYKPYAMNYKRCEERPEVQERLREMQATPKQDLYQEGQDPPADVDPEDDGSVILSYLWLMNELRRNMIDARTAGKFKESNEAIKLMAGLLTVENERSQKVDELAQRRARSVGIRLDAPSLHKTEVPQELECPPGLGGSSGDEFEDEAGDAIISPVDVVRTDGDD